MINATQFINIDLSVAMTSTLAKELRNHLDKGPHQEDLTFALWKPSKGEKRFTAVLNKLLLPLDGERSLHGNVDFTSDYVIRILKEAGEEYGIALLHSHISPGWQGMSKDDIIAEKDRLAAVVASRTGLPLLGLTRGTDGYWSARFWLRKDRNEYEKRWVSEVRVVGQELKSYYNHQLKPPVKATEFQVATVSVWGEEKQADLTRVHVGIIGLGSVGSIVAESLSRLGITHLTLIDHDYIEERNLDRTIGALAIDAKNKTPKVEVSKRLIEATHTSQTIYVDAFHGSLLQVEGLQKVLDCDVIFSCVDRYFPRHILNTLAYAHLIPVVDGGIIARVNNKHLQNVDWRIHTVGPERSCMACLGALPQEYVSLEMSGQLDNPSYIQGIGLNFNPMVARQNVFAFSLSAAAHEVLQFIGLVTGQPRVGGIGPQMYRCYPGIMEVEPSAKCNPNCKYSLLTASAVDLSGNINQYQRVSTSID